MRTRTAYPSDLSDTEWSQVCRVIPAPKPGGRPAVHDRRDVVDALLYVARTGCRWRALPHDLPPWATVYWYFRVWKKDGTFDRLMDRLRGDLRQAHGRLRQPSAAIIDSRSLHFPGFCEPCWRIGLWPGCGVSSAARDRGTGSETRRTTRR